MRGALPGPQEQVGGAPTAWRAPSTSASHPPRWRAPPEGTWRSRVAFATRDDRNGRSQTTAPKARVRISACPPCPLPTRASKRAPARRLRPSPGWKQRSPKAELVASKLDSCVQHKKEGVRARLDRVNHKARARDQVGIRSDVG